MSGDVHDHGNFPGNPNYKELAMAVEDIVRFQLLKLVPPPATEFDAICKRAELSQTAMKLWVDNIVAFEQQHKEALQSRIRAANNARTAVIIAKKRVQTAGVQVQYMSELERLKCYAKRQLVRSYRVSLVKDSGTPTGDGFKKYSLEYFNNNHTVENDISTNWDCC
jgi:hypothetical protein